MTDANTSSKTCFKCGACLPRTEFYKHAAMADGLLGKCKTCTKAYAADHRLKNADRIRAYDRERAKNPARAKMSAEVNARWRKEDRRRVAAHNAVARAIRAGSIEKQPCCVCGSDASLAHHESYDRPLDVVWYCQIHHKERHKQMAIQGIEP
jgi:hypothetical protein